VGRVDRRGAAMIGREGITCIDCGECFVRARGYVGEYCETCRPRGGEDYD